MRRRQPPDIQDLRAAFEKKFPEPKGAGKNDPEYKAWFANWYRFEELCAIKAWGDAEAML